MAPVSQSAATNLVVFSLLVFVVPLGLYAISSQGGLDCASPQAVSMHVRIRSVPSSVAPPPSRYLIPPAPAPSSSAMMRRMRAVIWTRLFGKPPTAWTRTVCSAVTAVIGVNGVLVAFLLAAFGEKTAEEVAKKED